jgi:glycosyltransferase involved in cell wall biosynthesis
MDKFIKALNSRSLDSVHLTGYVDEMKKRLYYAAADAFIFPTWLEGFGLPVAEAMAAGLPVITPSSGATAELVGHFGCLVKPGCVESYCSIIYDLIKDDEFKLYISEKLRLRAANLFDRSIMINKLEKVYNL